MPTVPTVPTVHGIMPFLRIYIFWIDRFNLTLGRIAMYGIFVMMAILAWSSISKTFFNPSLWTLEMAQFAMVAYYILGGPYALQLGANVRMDLLYGSWSPKKKALVDTITVVALIFFLSVLLYGAIDSTSYSLRYHERSATAWRPLLSPIKIIMCFGFSLMILQSISELFKDIIHLFQGEPFCPTK